MCLEDVLFSHVRGKISGAHKLKGKIILAYCLQRFQKSAPSQGSSAERAGRGETVPGMAGRREKAFLPAFFCPFLLHPGLLICATHTQDGPFLFNKSIIHTQPVCSTNQWFNPVSHTHDTVASHKPHLGAQEALQGEGIYL